jgi:hypothetical protein
MGNNALLINQYQGKYLNGFHILKLYLGEANTYFFKFFFIEIS